MRLKPAQMSIGRFKYCVPDLTIIMESMFTHTDVLYTFISPGIGFSLWSWSTTFERLSGEKKLPLQGRQTDRRHTDCDHIQEGYYEIHFRQFSVSSGDKHLHKCTTPHVSFALRFRGKRSISCIWASREWFWDIRRSRSGKLCSTGISSQGYVNQQDNNNPL